MFFINIDRGSPESLVNQVYEQLRVAILGGKPGAGEKLPSTRELAAFLNVSRNVVTTAYELLNAEGFLEGKHGSGSYVAQGVFWDAPARNRPDELSGLAINTINTHLKRNASLRNCNTIPQPEGGREWALIDFRSGIPALDLVPRKQLARLTQQSWLEAPDSALGYGHPSGSPALQKEIALYLHKSRGVVCEPEQIIITSGAVQGLSLIAQALVRPHDPILIEDPSNCDIAKIFLGRGAQVVPVPVDEYGMRTMEISRERAAQIKPVITVVTPSHQFPLGGILPIQRRIELVRMARETEGLIIEDDYDSEFRYEGPPVSSLQGLDPNRVIYLGTFSKILLPALRLGYMVLPHRLLPIFTDLKRLDDIHSSTLNQLALAQFIAAGHLTRHTVKMKKIYRQKRDILMKVLQESFPGRVRIFGVSTGLHLVAEFTGLRFDDRLLGQFRENGVGVYPVEAHTIMKGRHADKIILGFGHLSITEIGAGVQRMKGVLANQ